MAGGEGVKGPGHGRCLISLTSVQRWQSRRVDLSSWRDLWPMPSFAHSARARSMSMP